MRWPVAIAFGVAAGAVAGGLTLAAQDQLPQPTFRTEANYIRVDVFPTHDGVPVADLSAADFEISEDKVVQKIEQFEHVVIRPAGTGEGRPEPNTVAASRQAIQDPRARVFVLFLDPKNVDLATSRQFGPSLAKTLNRLMGPDDYLGVMRPGMSSRDISFARRTTAIENVLRNEWWGERDRDVLANGDATETTYASCYPAVPVPGQTIAADQGIAQEMILRRREQQTLDALEDVSLFLRGVREERKAVLAVTNGWLLYQPNPALARPVDRPPPTAAGVGVDPRSGKLTTKDSRSGEGIDLQICERDRLALSMIDDEQRLRTIMDEANRSNVSIYPIDPRGLTAFDEGIEPAAGVGVGPKANPPLAPDEDRARLSARNNSLRRLAEGTDGTALVGTNEIAEGLRRIADDLSSYYLLGYYSTGKLDGKFHAIRVRVKRAGVEVRARRGYLAPRPGDLASPQRSVSSSVAASSPELAASAAVSSAVAAIAGSVRDAPVRLHVTAGWRTASDGRPVPAFWAVTELADRIPGSDLEAVLTSSAGDIVATGRGRIAPGTTAAIVALVPGSGAAAGEYLVRVKSRSPGAAETVSSRVVLPEASQSSGAVFIRRGPLTGNKEAPTADVRFRRSERLRVEVPSSVDATGARLLDRTGKPLAIPVTAATRVDAEGTRWATAELVLAPLAAGDYVMEVTAGQAQTLVAFRVVL